jgi:hypothetical protein
MIGPQTWADETLTNNEVGLTNKEKNDYDIKGALDR